MQAEAVGKGAASARREAREFLLARLEAGPVKADDLQEGEQNGISKTTLRRAKRDLKISSWKEKKLPGEWLWQLPPKPKPTLNDV
jgi:hypothetical protein